MLRKNNQTASQYKAWNLLLHGPEFNPQELVINPEVFPHLQVNDICQVLQPHKTHPRLILKVNSIAAVKGNLQVSILKDIAAQFELEAFKNVIIKKIEPSSVIVDFIELMFKDQFMSRADIWRFKVALLGECLHAGKNVELLGIRAQVKSLLSSGQETSCGVVGSDTKFILRSKSSRIFWLIQMSTEMWEFADDGQVYFEKLLDSLIQRLLQRWRDSSTSHSLTVLLFSRSFYSRDQFPEDYDPTHSLFSKVYKQGFGPGCGHGRGMAEGYGPAINVDAEGRFYEDFYKVVVQDCKKPDWRNLLTLLKAEFVQYGRAHRWKDPVTKDIARYRIIEDKGMDSEQDIVQWEKLPHGVPSRAVDGNVLEAINVTLNILDKHFIDRDLNRTGQSIVMISAGCGVFKVPKKIAHMTKQRMMDNGIGMDMISLTTPPLHMVPLFIWQKQAAMRSFLPEKSRDVFFSHQDSPVSSPTAFSEYLHWSLSSSGVELPQIYNIPHWINISFVDLDCDCGEYYRTCLCAKKKEFSPLPVYRMFNIEAPSELHSFPTTLKKMLDMDVNRVENEVRKPREYRCEKMSHESKLDPSSMCADVIPLLPQATTLEEMQQHDAQVFTSALANLMIQPGLGPSRGAGVGLSKATTPSGRLPSPYSSRYSSKYYSERLRRRFSSTTNLRSLDYNENSPSMTDDLEGGYGKTVAQTDALGIVPSRTSSKSISLSRSFDKRGSGYMKPSQDRCSANELNSAREGEKLQSKATDPRQSGNSTGEESLSKFFTKESLGRSADSHKQSYAHRESMDSINAHDSPVETNTESGPNHRPSSATEATLFGSVNSIMNHSEEEHSPGSSLFGSSVRGIGLGTARASSAMPNQVVVNPFQLSMEFDYSQRLTSNRRRWSHLFPPKEAEFKLHAGPNWKSLTTPAVLPLTTDFYPQPNDLRNMYTESFYKLTLSLPGDSDPGSEYQDHEDLVTEMVCQRLAKDFQLVALDVGHGLGVSGAPAVDSTILFTGKRIRRGAPVTGSETVLDPPTIVYNLSMGHRIHRIVYDKELQTIEVKQYIKRSHGGQEGGASHVYKYSLWVPQTLSFHPVQQEFQEVTTNSSNWNFIDQVLCGYYDDLTDTTKSRQIHYCIIPPVLTSEEMACALQINFEKLIEYLQSRMEKNTKIDVSFPVYQQRCTSDYTTWLQSEPSTRSLNGSRLRFKIKLASVDDRQGWINLYMDSWFNYESCYHIDIRWLACSGGLVDDFISSLFRKCKQLNLNIRRVSGYLSSTFLQLHPLVTPIYLPIDFHAQRITSSRYVLISFLVNNYNFIFDEERMMDSRGICTSLGIQRMRDKYSLKKGGRRSEEEKLAEEDKYGYQQLLHRSLPLFVRITYAGIIWVFGKEADALVSNQMEELYRRVYRCIEAMMAVQDSIGYLLNHVEEALLRRP